MERNTLEVINDLLHIHLSPTVMGNEVRVSCPDPDGPGRMQTIRFLDRADAEDLAKAFRQLAEELCVPESRLYWSL